MPMAANELGQPDQRRPEPGGGELAGAVDPPVDGHLGPVAGQLRTAGRPPAPAVSIRPFNQ